MEIEVIVNSTQIIQDVTDKQSIKCKGTIKRLEKGTVLEFSNEEISFKMVLLKEKIILNRNNQKMIFELGKTTKSILETEYGIINIEVLTKQIKIKEKKDKISEILLEYKIILESKIEYLNTVKIEII